MTLPALSPPSVVAANVAGMSPTEKFLLPALITVKLTPSIHTEPLLTMPRNNSLFSGVNIASFVSVPRISCNSATPST